MRWHSPQIGHCLRTLVTHWSDVTLRWDLLNIDPEYPLRLHSFMEIVPNNPTLIPPIYETHFTYVDSIPKNVVKTKITWSPLPLAQRLPQRLPLLKNRFAILENFQTCAGCGRLWSELMYSCLLGGWSGVLLVLVVENSWQVETRLLQQCFTLLTAWQRPPPPSSPPPPPPRSSCLRPAHSPPQSLPPARSQDEKATVRCLRRPSQHWRLLLAPPPPPCRPGHFCSSLHFNLLGGPPLVSAIFLCIGQILYRTIFAWSFLLFYLTSWTSFMNHMRWFT